MCLKINLKEPTQNSRVPLAVLTQDIIGVGQQQKKKGKKKEPHESDMACKFHFCPSSLHGWLRSHFPFSHSSTAHTPTDTFTQSQANILTYSSIFHILTLLTPSSSHTCHSLLTSRRGCAILLHVLF